MVKELILDRDEVTLPGVGTFVAETVPASFSDKGYTINPPYRKLSFRQRQNAADTALVDLYIKSNKGVDPEQARKFVTDFLLEMKEVLKAKKNIVFPGLGRLRSTKENNFFFVADEELDIYPGGFGLEPISLKTHLETPEEVSAVIQQLGKEILTVPSEPQNDNVVATEDRIRPEAVGVWGSVSPSIDSPDRRQSVWESVSPSIDSPDSRQAVILSEVEESQNKEEEPVLPEEEGDFSAPAAPPVEMTVEEPVEMTTTDPVILSGVEESHDKEEPVILSGVEESQNKEEEPVLPEEEGDFSAPAAPPVEMTVEEPVEMTVEEPVEMTTTDPVILSEVEESKNKKKIIPRWVKVVLWIVGVIVVATALYMLAARMFPDFFDSILYSNEELKILNY
ncbi:MAG: hypothetical protein IJ151_08175 [Bacteroidales bacterium]|nr:hypothetical protein [Bacteroidales bacterium]